MHRPLFKKSRPWQACIARPLSRPDFSGSALLRLVILSFALVFTAPVAAQDFPKLSGRVVDAANLLPAGDEAALTAKLEALEQKTSRQLVVATVPDLQGYAIEDYGYKLGRAWGIGQTKANNGVILLVAPNERKVRIEVGYGLEPILTDALSSVIINQTIVPRFRDNDYPGGINAGADAIIEQLAAPPEVAEQKIFEAAQQRAAKADEDDGGSAFSFFFWALIFFFVILPRIVRRATGKRHRGPSGLLPILLWGPDLGGGHRGGWGGGGGFGGFSGGGGSFGGGGASGGW